jgi:hypothetical protein
MTLLELITHLRKNILHDTGGTGTDWSSWTESDYDSIQLRWDNEELTGYINAAIDMVYRRTNPIKDFYQLDIEAGTNSYNLPSYILEVLKAKRETGKYIEERSMDDFWNFSEYNTKSGEPSSFFTDVEQGKIRFYPTPLTDETIDLMIYRLPVSKLSWDNPEASPELREEYQIPMLYGAASLCYLKDEANILDPQRANTFSLMFDREFPFTSAYSNIRKGRTANRPVRYGGIGGVNVKRSNWQNRSERY